MDMLNKINFHDADIVDYVKEGNNISFLLKDGWNEDTYYKIKLNNVKVFVMDNIDCLVSYILDKFTNIGKCSINLYSGNFGKMLGDSDGKKYYLKLWIRYPNDLPIKIDNVVRDYKFDEFDVSLCNDYDDTGNLYIKFLADSVQVLHVNCD